MASTQGRKQKNKLVCWCTVTRCTRNDLGLEHNHLKVIGSSLFISLRVTCTYAVCAKKYFLAIGFLCFFEFRSTLVASMCWLSPNYISHELLCSKVNLETSECAVYSLGLLWYRLNILKWAIKALKHCVVLTSGGATVAVFS